MNSRIERLEKWLIYATVILLLLFIISVIATTVEVNRNAEELREEFKKLNQEFKKLEERCNTLELALQYDTSITTPIRLKRVLYEQGVPNPELWAKIAVIETGDRNAPWLPFNNKHVKVAHNFFCFHFNPCTKTMTGTMEFGKRKEKIAVFRSKVACIDFLKEWIYLSPQRVNESDEAFLKRRGFNTECKRYWEILKNVKV